jgi:hypothetical protein
MLLNQQAEYICESFKQQNRCFTQFSMTNEVVKHTL